MKRSLIIGTLLLAFLAGAAFNAAEEEKEQTLDAKVKEIFSRSCATSGCHSGKNPKMGLDLEAEHVPGNMTGVKSVQNPELMLIDVKDPAKSYLLLKITGGEGMKGKKMPIFKKALTEEEIKAVEKWIGEAAAAVAEKEKAAEKTEAKEDKKEEKVD